MIKSELVRVLSEKLPKLQIRDVELAVNCILAQMADALAQGQRIEVRGFGGFDLHHSPARIGRNPRTGESLSLPAKVKVHFKPGKDMKDRVDAARDQFGITDEIELFTTVSYFLLLSLIGFNKSDLNYR